MRKLSIVFVLIMLCSVCLFSACDGCKGCRNTEDPENTKKIITEVENLQVQRYTKEKLKYTLEGFTEDEEQTLTIVSDNEKIASYKDGFVYGVTEGETDIKLTCGEVSSSIKVTVLASENLPTLKFNKEEVSILIDGTLPVSAQVMFKGKAVDFTDIQYTIADTTVATIDDNGVVKGLKTGKTTLTAKCTYFDTTV